MGNVDKEIGLRIFNRLNISGKTQAELADYLGVTQASVSNWVNGVKIPRMDKIDKICEFLNCTRSDLLVGESQDSSLNRLFHYYFSMLSKENQDKVVDVMKAFLAAQNTK